MSTDIKYAMMHAMRNALPDVKIQQYEGPYDLLVELAQKRQLDISEISLQDLTEPFLKHMKEHKISPEIVASFIVVASTLLLLKARRILPQLEDTEQEEIEELTFRLQIYEKYRESTQVLAAMWNISRLLPAHFFAEGEQVSESTSMPQIAADMLAQALEQKIASIPRPRPQAHLTHRGRSLKEILMLFTSRLQSAKRLIFQEHITGAPRQEQVVSFLAVLEMARKEEVTLTQTEPFGEIVLERI